MRLRAAGVERLGGVAAVRADHDGVVPGQPGAGERRRHDWTPPAAPAGGEPAPRGAARTMPKKPGSPEASTTAGPGVRRRRRAGRRAGSSRRAMVRTPAGTVDRRARCRGRADDERRRRRAAARGRRLRQRARRPGRPTSPVITPSPRPPARSRRRRARRRSRPSRRRRRARPGEAGEHLGDPLRTAGRRPGAAARRPPTARTRAGRCSPSATAATQRRAPPASRGDRAEQGRVDLGARVVGHQDAAGELGELAGHADEDHLASGRRSTACAQRRAGEVADLDEADLGQVGQQRAWRPSRCARRCASTSVGSPCAAITRHRLHDAGPPRRGGEGPDDAGGAEDRDAAEDAEPARWWSCGPCSSPSGTLIDHADAALGRGRRPRHRLADHLRAAPG